MLELLGPDEFERTVCPLNVAHEGYRRCLLRNERMEGLVVERLARADWS